jgi:two-component system copper resistance phosphate regulon response regulator CusR
VLLLAALNSLEDKVQGFEAGADDYLAKPFAFKELLLQARSLTHWRTVSTAQERQVLRLTDLGMNLTGKVVTRAKQNGHVI